MKSTQHFKNTIESYLNRLAQEDNLFAIKYNNPNKKIDDCITYILNYVQKSGCNGFTDDEIYSQAVHYYEEEKIDVGKDVKCSVVVNHVVELTEEEKREARKKAIEQYQQQELTKMQNRKKSKPTTTTDNQPSLFDF